MKASITILIATYNRESVLHKTLENLKNLDTTGLELSIVVVDNNSSDGTAELIKSYQSSLPLTYLFQSKPGKNRALNLALDTIELGDIILFTDDDVMPTKQWLRSIVDSTEKYQDKSIFGGPVHMLWPENSPQWAKDLERDIYPQHDYGNSPKVYEGGVTPIGPNFWLRKKIITEGQFRYDESIGPTPDSKKRIMGSETSFLYMLINNGYSIQYVPGNSVGHYVTEDQITEKYIMKRASTHGRFLAHIGKAFDNLKLYKKNIVLWKLLKLASLLKNRALFQMAYLSSNKSIRLKKQINAKRWIAYNESYISDHNNISQRSTQTNLSIL
ncbi:glycosyltransferase [Puniceicoccaceae bacterium K14]|nr:glycosyltransferase [Puniceicoccaceae bacterium K14]